MAGAPVQKERDRFGRQAEAATSPIDRRRRRDWTRHQVSFARAGARRRVLPWQLADLSPPSSGRCAKRLDEGAVTTSCWRTNWRT